MNLMLLNSTSLRLVAICTILSEVQGTLTLSIYGDGEFCVSCAFRNVSFWSCGFAFCVCNLYLVIMGNG